MYRGHLIQDTTILNLEQCRKEMLIETLLNASIQEVEMISIVTIREAESLFLIRLERNNVTVFKPSSKSATLMLKNAHVAQNQTCPKLHA